MVPTGMTNLGTAYNAGGTGLRSVVNIAGKASTASDTVYWTPNQVKTYYAVAFGITPAAQSGSIEAGTRYYKQTYYDNMAETPASIATSIYERGQRIEHRFHFHRAAGGRSEASCTGRKRQIRPFIIS